ncbi:MAG: diguanylate cyclase [Pseudomonadota bacterium]
MYHFNNMISIYTKTGQMENWLRQIPVPEGFEYSYKTCYDLTDDTFADSDIIILDLPYSSSELDMVRRKKKKAALIVLCILPEEQGAMAAEAYSLIDALWIKPLGKEAATFHFSKLMDHLKLEKELELNQKYLDSVIESIPDMVWFKDLKGTHLKVNNSFCRAVGKTKEDIKGKSHYYIWDISKEEYEKGEAVCLDTDVAVLQERKPCVFNEKVKIKDGFRQLITYKTPILDDKGEPIGTVGIAHDVTDLLNKKAELEILLEHIPFSLLFFDTDGKVQSVNKRFEEYFDINKTDIVGSEYDEWASSLLSIHKGSPSDIIHEVKTGTGYNEKIIRVHKEPVYDIFNSITGYFCIYTDITMEHRIHERAMKNANTDYLTGLYNRRYLYATISGCRQNNCLCLLYIDLDDFKLINDEYGHKAGDKALVSIAGILREQFPGQAVFRLGGDEFLVAVTEGCSIDRVKEYAQNFLDCIKGGIRPVDVPIRLSASIGIVIDTDSSLDFDELLKHGDSALYRAKQNGKNQYYIWTSQE